MKNKVLSKDKVALNRNSNEYVGHTFYDSNGIGYVCMGYSEKFKECVFLNTATLKEVVGCMDAFYYSYPTIKELLFVEKEKVKQAEDEAALILKTRIGKNFDLQAPEIKKLKSFFKKNTKKRQVTSRYREGTTPSELWNAWSKSQKNHFVKDHFDYDELEKSSVKNYHEKEFNKLPKIVQSRIRQHMHEGRYATGGKIDKTTEEKPLSYYKYSTKKVMVAWLGKIQPMGMFYSAEEAMQEIKKQAQTEEELKQYSIVTPDKTIHLGKEYTIRFKKGGLINNFNYNIGGL